MNLPSFIGDSMVVGGIYSMNYRSALVLTNDFYKEQCGGVPLGGFLLARESGPHTDEVVLLRINDTAPLPNESDLTSVRLDVVREAAVSGKDMNDVSDLLTRDELQWSALNCEVLGTFYEELDKDGEHRVIFGSDIDNVIQSVKFQVFSPDTDTLSRIASYSEGKPADLVIGKVRFSSTRRRARTARMDESPVSVVVDDFVSRKSAVLGMTRTGKSNSIKTLVTAVFRYGWDRYHRTKKYPHEADRLPPVGQIIFDPQGEYANPNKQDGTGLVQLGDISKVMVYRFGASGKNPQERPLGINFYELDDLIPATEFINSALMSAAPDIGYLNNFVSIDWGQPANHHEYANWSRGRVGLYGLLYICGYKGGFSQRSSTFPNPGLDFSWNKDLYDDFLREDPQNANMVTQPSTGSTYIAVSPEAAARVMQFMKAQGSWDTSRSKGGELPFAFISKVLDMVKVKSIVRTLQTFHNPNNADRVEVQLWEDMCAGRLSIIDLSYGNSTVAKVMSERMVHHLLNESNRLFTANKPLVPYQVVVEEAHNLFERGGREASNDPWVRLSKEAAKYQVGLVYATQEVSSVDRRVLSNTSNWLVAHLNSGRETNELGDYYDFRTWADSLRRCEDVGFVRMKTYSGKYIVPVQVAKFDDDMVTEARAVGEGKLIAQPVNRSGGGDGHRQRKGRPEPSDTTLTNAVDAPVTAAAKSVLSAVSALSNSTDDEDVF